MVRASDAPLLAGGVLMPGAECQLRLRLLKDDAIALGPGKIELLEAVREQGSISKAARRLDMSYRRAWLLINTMNACFPAPLVETVKGGEKGGGARLSALGDEVLRRYRALERRMLEQGGEDLRALLALLASPE